MTPIWRTHLTVCCFSDFWLLPYITWIWLTGAGGGSWITLDFHGLIFWAYVALVVIDIALSSIGVASFPSAKASRIHLCSIVLSVILLAVGFVIYGKLMRARVSGQQVPLLKNHSITNQSGMHFKAAKRGCKLSVNWSGASARSFE